jgi:hypothetical protein
MFSATHAQISVFMCHHYDMCMRKLWSRLYEYSMSTLYTYISPSSEYGQKSFFSLKNFCILARLHGCFNRPHLLRCTKRFSFLRVCVSCSWIFNVTSVWILRERDENLSFHFGLWLEYWEEAQRNHRVNHIALKDFCSFVFRWLIWASLWIRGKKLISRTHRTDSITHQYEERMEIFSLFWF